MFFMSWPVLYLASSVPFIELTKRAIKVKGLPRAVVNDEVKIRLAFTTHRELWLTVDLFGAFRAILAADKRRRVGVHA